MKQYYIIGNGTEWCYYSWKGFLESNHNIHFFNEQIPIGGNRWMKKLCVLHYSIKMNKRHRFPGKSLWHKAIVNYMGIKEDDENILIVYDRSRLNFDFAFWNYLRKRFGNIKIVYLFSNIIKFTGAREWGIVGKLSSVFDHVFAFDKQDAIKYKFDYSPLIYTPCINMEGNTVQFDLFYIGQAKDRLSQLLKVFEQAKKEGLKCDFYIKGVPESQQKYSDQIHYSFSNISYRDILEKMKSARAIVDMIQGESTGLTIKTCEAVIYDKKLITSNTNIKDECFYNEKNILIYDGTKSIKKFLDSQSIRYSKEAKEVFSPYKLFEQI